MDVKQDNRKLKLAEQVLHEPVPHMLLHAGPMWQPAAAAPSCICLPAAPRMQDFLGEGAFLLSDLLTAPGQSLTVPLKDQHGRPLPGCVAHLSAEELPNTNAVVNLALGASKLENKDTFGKSDPFVRVSKARESGAWVPVLKTGGEQQPQPHVAPLQHVPRLALQLRRVPPPDAGGGPACMVAGPCHAFADVSTLTLPMRALRPPGACRPPATWREGRSRRSVPLCVMQVFDSDPSGSHELIGRCEASLQQLQAAAAAGQGLPLVSPKKQGKPGYANSGVLLVKSVTVTLRPSFLEYIQGGWRGLQGGCRLPSGLAAAAVGCARWFHVQAQSWGAPPWHAAGGVELSFIVALDFTASNGDPRDPASLHHFSQRPTLYEGGPAWGQEGELLVRAR